MLPPLPPPQALRKDVLLKRNQIDHTKAERAILEAVSHPFIVTLRYGFQTREKLYLITNFAPGGELFFWCARAMRSCCVVPSPISSAAAPLRRLKRDRIFSQERARLYAAELVLALEHLHAMNVVYRDLKVGGRRRPGVEQGGGGGWICLPKTD